MIRIAFKAAKYYGIYKVIDLVSGGRVGKAVGTVTAPVVNAVKKVGEKLAA